VLIIDDEPTIIEVVVRAVQQLGEGIEVATASDGFEAGLQIATFKPDLLVLDLMMPQIDGFEVCRVVRKSPSTAHIKILIITAYGIHENIERALKSGADDFMHKPLNIPSLVAKVGNLLAERYCQKLWTGHLRRRSLRVSRPPAARMPQE
jgi:CheY-like chemotaxis protein